MIAFDARPIKGSSNQIIDQVTARLSLRTVPNMDAVAAGKAVIKKLTAKPPHRAKVTAEIVGSTPWWMTDPEYKSMKSAVHIYDELPRVAVSRKAPASSQKR